MAVSIYVGNLPFSATQEGVEAWFAPYGDPLSVKLIMHRETGRPRGFCCVEMDEADAHKAIEALNGVDFGGRTLRINQAEERRPAPRRW